MTAVATVSLIISFCMLSLSNCKLFNAIEQSAGHVQTDVECICLIWYIYF